MAPQSLQSHEIARRKIRMILGKLPSAPSRLADILVCLGPLHCPPKPATMRGMLAKLKTFSLLGIDALPVEVEVDVSPLAPACSRE